MANSGETAYLSRERLNALTIAGSKRPTDLSALVLSMVETQGSTLGPAERALHDGQAKAVEPLTADAVLAAGDACTTDGAEFSVASVNRVGDGFDGMGVRFECSLPEGECCRLGLRAAVDTMHTQSSAAQETVREDPLGQFQLFGG